LYQSTSKSKNYFDRAAGYSDRIDGGKGLTARLFMPIEEARGWDRAEIEVALRLLANQRQALSEAARLGDIRRKDLDEKVLQPVKHEGQRIGFFKAKRNLKKRMSEIRQQQQDVRIHEDYLQRLLVNLNIDRELDLYQRAVSNIVGFDVAQKIEGEFRRMKIAAERGA
jgi:hypothetical protein